MYVVKLCTEKMSSSVCYDFQLPFSCCTEDNASKGNCVFPDLVEYPYLPIWCGLWDTMSIVVEQNTFVLSSFATPQTQFFYLLNSRVCLHIVFCLPHNSTWLGFFFFLNRWHQDVYIHISINSCCNYKISFIRIEKSPFSRWRRNSKANTSSGSHRKNQTRGDKKQNKKQKTH